jgi:proteasome ATPase
MANDAEQVIILKSALQQAKQKLVAQNEVLQRLTAEPLRFATVISVKPETRVENAEIIEGNNARVLRGDMKGRTGKIIEVSPDTVVLTIGGGEYDFTIAPSASELSQLVKLREGQTAEKGAKVEIVADDRMHKTGRIGTLADEPDETNIVSVNFAGYCQYDGYNNCTHDFYIDLGPAIEPLGTVTYGTAVVLFDGKEVEVKLPADKDVKVGDTAKLSMQTLQIVDVIETKFAGEIVGVQRVLDNASSEVEFQGGTRAVYNGRFDGQLNAGDRVVLDPSGLVIIRNLGQEDKKDDLFVFTEKTNVSWSDIGGLADAKREMMEAIELPYKFGDFYSFYGKKPLKGVLLYGPPGCGKTMLGKAAATALANIHEGKGAETCFMYVKAPEILSKFVGVAEGTVRRLFSAARKHKQENGYPAVIFIDEADAIMNKRGSGVSSDIERTIVPMFLAEMDGFDDSGAIMILATNRADTLDPAIVREGRISRKIKVTRPTRDTAVELFQLKLANVPLYNGSTREQLATTAATDLFSTERVLYRLTVKDNATHPFTLGNLCSGAMIAEIVDQATSVALHRDITAGKPQGMRADDLKEAINCAFRQNADLNHEDDIDAFVETLGTPVVSVRRAVAA